ncbi:MAG: methyltransferase domain-containing protein [Gaiellaceae bacterium]
MSLRDLERQFGRRLARVATNAVVARPGLWRAFRGPIRKQFDRLASSWDSIRSPDALAPLERALETIPSSPRRVLDLGTGTGAAALAIARRFPEAEVVGVDVSGRMLDEARRKMPPELAGRVRFEQADAERLPYPGETFDLVSLANMIPFFDELARVTAPGGWVAFTFSAGPETPIWVPPERLRSELVRRGFADFAEFQQGSGTAVLVRKGGRS